jgi:Xaa-Pro aminopeptidase
VKEAHRISETALEDLLNSMKPGMTEKQALGIVYESLYRNGAECEGFPNYVFGGKKTSNAIARATYDTIKTGELIQLCIGARYGGYSFFTCDDYGFRWEDGFKVTAEGGEPFSDKRSEIIEL